MTLAEFKSELRLMGVTIDPWGTTLEALFQIAATLYDNGFEVPSAWEFRPAQISSKQAEPDSYWFELLSDLSEENLIVLGNFANRYSDLLRQAGKDY